MRRILTICFCLLYLFANAQTAMKVLDATASKIKSSGDVKVNFTATSYNGTSEEGSISGIMCLQGKKLTLSTPEMKTWYDGKTQWSMIQGSGEVNMTHPTEKEMAAMNPYTFINLYKRGYKMSMKETTLRGQSVYEVHMIARYAGSMAQEIYVDVNKNTYTPLCIRIRQDDNWNRITIHSLQGGQKFDKDFFTFPKSEYNDVEIIDLR